ncbi:MAG: O-succinylhomoserine sulfhydrylase [Flavobacteriaceae bacterium]
MKTTWNKKTNLVHAGNRRSQFNEVSEAIFLTQSFVYETAEDAEKRFASDLPNDDFIYTRYGNPTIAMFEDKIAAIEGAEAAFATASGMAAVNGALMSMLSAGDHVVAARALFGSCLYILENILPSFGVRVTFVDGTDLNQWKKSISQETKVVFFESISNPTLEVIDIKAVANIAKSVGALTVVDNVFTTPIFSNALSLGADVVVYSATKHIDGQGRTLGGVILGSEDYIRNTVEPFMKHTGGSMSPFTGWVLLKGLETLDLRVQAQSDSALEIAKSLIGHESISSVIYPGLETHPQYDLCREQMKKGGTVIAFELLGGKEAAFSLMNSLELVLISNNLGDAKSIITHPATTTHQRLSADRRQQLGITQGLLRLSVGLEDSKDLIKDLSSALGNLVR